MIAVSDAPIKIQRENWYRVIESTAIDGKPIFDTGNPTHKKRVDFLRAQLDNYMQYDDKNRALLGLETRQSILQRTKNEYIVTDNNMGREWRMWPYNKRHFGNW
jgi:hypothetical protein